MSNVPHPHLENIDSAKNASVDTGYIDVTALSEEQARRLQSVTIDSLPRTENAESIIVAPSVKVDAGSVPSVHGEEGQAILQNGDVAEEHDHDDDDGIELAGTTKDNPNFSSAVRELAAAIDEQDEDEFISHMEQNMQGHDVAGMRLIFSEFRRLQNAVAELAEEPSEANYTNFQSALQRFFHIAETYTSHVPSDASPGTAEAARADTVLERTELGKRLRLLIEQMHEMISSCPKFSDLFDSKGRESWSLKDDRFLIRPSITQRSTARVLANDRQLEMWGYINQAEKMYGSNGLKYTDWKTEMPRTVGRGIDHYTRRAFLRGLSNIRNQVLRLTLAGLLAAGGTGTMIYKGIQYLRGGKAASTATKDPGAGPSTSKDALPKEKVKPKKTPDELNLEKVNKIFEGMDIDIKGGRLVVTFDDLDGFVVNEDLVILMGAGVDLNPRRFNKVGEKYVADLTPAERTKDAEINVSLRVNVGKDQWLVPKKESGEYDHKTQKAD